MQKKHPKRCVTPGCRRHKAPEAVKCRVCLGSPRGARGKVRPLKRWKRTFDHAKARRSAAHR